MDKIKSAALIMLVMLVTGCGSEPKSVKELVDAGKQAITRKEYSLAREYFVKAVAQRPTDRDILYYLGYAYHRDFLLDSALFYYQRANLLFPNDRETNLQIYDAAVAFKDWQVAIRAVNVLIKTGDPIENWYVRLVDLHARNGNGGLAYRFAHKLVEHEPERPGNYIRWANAAMVIDSLDLAIRICDSAIKLFGESKEFVANRGLYYAYKSDYRMSERIFRSLHEKDTSSEFYILNLANALASQKSESKKRQALELYRQLAPGPDDTYRIDSLTKALEATLGLKKDATRKK